jgi:hypothetical protein
VCVCGEIYFVNQYSSRKITIDPRSSEFEVVVLRGALAHGRVEARRTRTVKVQADFVDLHASLVCGSHETSRTEAAGR